METNIHLNYGEKSLLIEILHDELKSELLSQNAKAVIMALIQKLNEVDA